MIKTNQILRKGKTTVAGFVDSGRSSFGPGSMSMSNVGGGHNRNHYDTVLQNVVSEDKLTLQRMYKDIYQYDPIGGSYVDLMSTMPFSNFTLTGIDDDNILETYWSNISRLNIRKLLPELSIDTLVTGGFVSTLVYNSASNLFTDMIPFDYGSTIVHQAPLYSKDPVLVVSVSDEIHKFLRSDSPHFISIKERISPKLLEALKGNQMELDPLITLYNPNKSFSWSKGDSVFRRIVPLWLFEKLMFRGTLTEAEKRQRSSTHISMGNEEWEPSEDEFSSIVGLFQQADLDPMGAIIATRNDVNTNEIRIAGDFFKYTDIIDITSALKMRALGISESFLSGEGSYSTMEVALSIFMEHTKNYRTSTTNNLMYNKLFPLIATMNEFFVSDSEQARMKPSMITADQDRFTRQEVDFKMNDDSKLLMPEIRWEKQLQPRGDAEYLSTLTSLKDAGLPPTLSMLATAGGMDIDSFLHDQKRNLEHRKTMLEMEKEFDQVKKDLGITGEGSEESFASMTRNKELMPMSILDRDFGSLSDGFKWSKSGKSRVSVSSAELNKGLLNVERALHNLSDPDTYALRSKQAQAILKSGKILKADGSLG